MTIDTSKETSYVVQSTLPTDQVMVMKENCYVVMKPIVITGTAQIIVVNM